MKKEKSYENTRFSAEVVKQALGAWESEFGSGKSNVAFPLLSLTQQGETWEHDELEEFLRGYDEGAERALLVARIDDESKLSLSHTPYSSAVAVEGEHRGKIQVVFSIFEQAIKNGEFESLEPKSTYNDNLVDPDSGAHNQSRRLTIQDKIIRASDLAKLGKRLEASLSGGQTDGRRISFDLEWANNSSISLSDGESFERELKEADVGLHSVRMRLRDYSLGREVECQLMHGNSYRENMLEVSGPERQWVTDTYSIAENTINSFRPQRKSLRKTEPVVVTATFILCIWGTQKIGYPIIN